MRKGTRREKREKFDLEKRRRETRKEKKKTKKKIMEFVTVSFLDPLSQYV